ncbi:MAG: UDP-N-acetylmuramoyl-L-alanine--D-glutamate ligase [Gammaproteobacteria bacterium]|nr:UDP-N-acetylmuramoyl-L-alanine--D-glutamate ligase [Gammaproteobacteria bacterium]
MPKQLLVLGLGKTGLSIVRHLSLHQIDCLVYDTRDNPPEKEHFQSLYPHIELVLGDYPSHLLDSVAKIITSPGLAPSTPLLQEAASRGIPIESDFDIFADLIDAPIIGITGANGKSTVTTLVGEMAAASGINVAVGGNLGTPVLELLEQHPKAQLWVFELSSFQLLYSHRLHFDAATILNITPDHIDFHGSMTNYIDAKQRIYQHTKLGVFSREDALTYPQHRQERQISFGLSTPTNPTDWGIINTSDGPALAQGHDIWIHAAQMKIQGQHNWLNALAAMALASSVGISRQAICQVLNTFKGLRHRAEWVRELAGVHYVNDSKATNLGASLAAIEGVGPTISGKIILIAGGLGKGAEFKHMRSALTKYVAHVVLIGKDANILADDWAGACPLHEAKDLAEAVKCCASLAKPGDMVLLSPACASLDMFNDYQDRGEQFIDCVKGL